MDTVRGFTFTFPNLTNSQKILFEPSADLINKESGTEETPSVPTQILFYSSQKTVEIATKICKYYINGSYFLHDKSESIKETIITVINKKISIYGSISYFNKKKEKEVLKIITPETYLKFYFERYTTKNSLSFQLANINGNPPKLKDKKIHNFSLTKIGEKEKGKCLNQ